MLVVQVCVGVGVSYLSGGRQRVAVYEEHVVWDLEVRNLWGTKQVSVSLTVQLFSLGNLIQRLLSPGLCRRLVSPLDWRSDPPSAGCRHTPARPACRPSPRPPGRRTILITHVLFHIIFTDCLEAVSDLCCPPVVPSLTCTSSTLGWVNRNCSTSAG